MKWIFTFFEKQAGTTEKSSKIILEPGCFERISLRELWQFRELLFFLAWREILVRYKQTYIGMAWAILRPAVTMIVFSILFGTLAKFPADGKPYPLLVYAGVLPWQFFSTGLLEAGNSLISNPQLLTKIYFPRLLIPFSSIFVCAIDGVIAFGLLLFMGVFWQVFPSWQILTLPLFAGLGFLLTLGCGAWVAALNTAYRDFRYIVPFCIQIGLYFSPVGYSSQIVPESWRYCYFLNPLVGVIEGFRWAILGITCPGLEVAVGFSLGISLFVLVTGLRFFRRRERLFAEQV